MGYTYYSYSKNDKNYKRKIIKIEVVTPENAIKETFFYIKGTKRQGFKDKANWFEKCHKEGLRIKILKNDEDKMICFIEYMSAKNAWRPIGADNYMFIHTYIYLKKREVKAMYGVCVMTSKGG